MGLLTGVLVRLPWSWGTEMTNARASRISNLTLFFLHESPQFKAIQNTTQSRKDRRKSPFHQDSRVKALKLASGRLYISDVQRPPRNSRLPCFDDERIFMRYTDLTRDGGSL